MQWNIKSMGNVAGSVRVAGDVLAVSPLKSANVNCECATLSAIDGKFGDSEDSFVFMYRTIDPNEANFSLRAVVSACETDGSADQQSGFGILLADTDASETKASRHRNSLLVGSFGKSHSFGIRIVSGYEDAAACESGSMRSLDTRRAFRAPAGGALSNTPLELAIEKTDEGLLATLNGESLFISGCSFLAVQNPRALCVGFAVARRVQMDVRIIRFETTPGTMSRTPDGTLQRDAVRYPFPAQIMQGLPEFNLVEDALLHVAPNGKPDATGTIGDPLSLESALHCAGPGTEIVLANGRYTPRVPLLVARRQSGTRQRPIKLSAQTSRACVIDGSCLPHDTPLLVLAGDFWHIRGVVLENSPLSGLTIFGNDNLVEDCEARENGDSGMLVISMPGAPRPDWPQRNLLIDCDSHHNRDEFGTNADGFGAKLRVGSGNAMHRCVAHHNVDDGFDLYTKSLMGQIEPVQLESCIAYCNGRAGETGGDGKPQLQGAGFKLGGEKQPVRHELRNCLAFGNARDGFSSNSNDAGRLLFCTSFCNGAERNNVEHSGGDLLRVWCAAQNDWSYSDNGDLERA